MKAVLTQNSAAVRYVAYLLGVCSLLQWEPDSFNEETRELCRQRQQILDGGDSYSDDGIDALLN